MTALIILQFYMLLIITLDIKRMQSDTTAEEVITGNSFPFFILTFSLLPIYVLLRRPTRDWFRLAARLRAEHRQQRPIAH